MTDTSVTRCYRCDKRIHTEPGYPTRWLDADERVACYRGKLHEPEAPTKPEPTPWVEPPRAKMTGPEHFREAERLIEQAKDTDIPAEPFNDAETVTLMAAQVHATLALAAATADAAELAAHDGSDLGYTR